MQTTFPLRGIIGVVANSIDEINLAKDKALQCVELRADLLLDAGLSEDELFTCVRHAKELGLAVLFTLRHPTHGGTFNGSEQQRVTMSQKAIDTGADLFDLEWGTEAAAIALAGNNVLTGDNVLAGDNTVPMILSYHNFSGMPTAQELQDLTAQMESAGARAIKVVPTASTIDDSLAMLRWVGHGNASVSRIGFAMGEAGASSRILTTVLGGEVTYASFGAPVAPGQIDIDELVSLYRVNTLNDQAQVTAVCMDGDAGTKHAAALNQSYNQNNQVAVRFAESDAATLREAAQWLRISDFA